MNVFQKARLKDCITFFILAIIGLIVGITFTFRNVKVKKEYVRTTAIISQIDKYYDGDSETGDVYLDYTTLDNIQYNHIYLNFYSMTFKVGRQLDILYKIDEPTKIMTYLGYWLPPLISYSLSFTFLILGGLIIILDLKKAKDKEKKIEENRDKNGFYNDEDYSFK